MCVRSAAPVDARKPPHSFCVHSYTTLCPPQIYVYGCRVYLASSWNVLDFMIVLSSLAYYIVSALPGLRGVRSIRVLRVLRPLRLMSRNPGMRHLIDSLGEALPSIWKVICDKKQVLL